MESKWLPIGSVVKVNDVPIVIAGYQANCKGKYYRYAGFVYPIGFYDAEQVFFFNPDSIQIVLFEGYKFQHYSEVEKILAAGEKKIKEEKE